MNKILRRLLKRPEAQPATPFDVVTETDVYYCYRLLLNREPDEYGLTFWDKQVGENRHTLKTLTDSFINSSEFLIRRENTLFAFFVAAARQIQLIDLKDFKMYARENDVMIGGPIIRGYPYEPHVVQAMRPLLKPGMVFVDVGANIGYFSLLAASVVGPTGKVIAFEPNLDNCELLKLGIQANHFENIELHPQAVADREQTLLLETSGSNGWVRPLPGDGQAGNLSATSNPDDSETAERRYLVKTVVLDNILRDVSHVDMIKIDIEGAEMLAFRGMRGIIQKHRPVIFSEFSPGLIELRSGSSGEAYLSALRECGYDLYVVFGDDRSTSPQSNADIMEYFTHMGINHVDIVARPR